MEEEDDGHGQCQQNKGGQEDGGADAVAVLSRVVRRHPPAGRWEVRHGRLGSGRVWWLPCERGGPSDYSLLRYCYFFRARTGAVLTKVCRRLQMHRMMLSPLTEGLDGRQVIVVVAWVARRSLRG
ncbi:hypothetical protein MUK42_34899 [Musa troglodytarum]|uniref:Uncharacterized protein n=1 Tax=Musa troglodytarum TaxID=320322 RepID=A0A9E7J976_9LILI|nr:hypothetical protein MUK42_34899 [Musa troglodytarum]